MEALARGCNKIKKFSSKGTEGPFAPHLFASSIRMEGWSDWLQYQSVSTIISICIVLILLIEQRYCEQYLQSFTNDGSVFFIVGTGCKQVNDRAVIALALYCPGIEVLNLHSCDVSYSR